MNIFSIAVCQGYDHCKSELATDSSSNRWGIGICQCIICAMAELVACWDCWASQSSRGARVLFMDNECMPSLLSDVGFILNVRGWNLLDVSKMPNAPGKQLKMSSTCDF